MQKALPVMLSLALVGCGVLPIPQAEAPTAAVIIQTVLVTVVPTEQPTATPSPTLAASTSPQVIIVTATPQTGGTYAAPSETVPAEEATAPLPPNPGGDVFSSLTRSGDRFSLRCQPDSLSFGVSTGNVYVTGVDFWYRIQDRLSSSISNWQFGGSMESDKHGNFTLAFPSSRVDADLRSHRAWFDYQFIGVNKTGDVVGRSAKIAKQVTYTIDCDD